jgi:hypothetical protein
VTSDEIKARYPRLIGGMMWVAILSEGEATACIRDYKQGYSFSGEAVNHFGGPHVVIKAAARARVRHLMADLTRWGQMTKPIPANYRSLGG